MDGVEAGSGAVIQLVFTPGKHTVTCVVTDPHGATGFDEVLVSATWSFGGFLPPVKDGEVLKSAQTLPVKLSLPVIEFDARLYVGQVVNGVVVNEIPAASSTQAGNRFTRNGNHYQFNLDTTGYSPGAYRLRVDLGDGADHVTHFTIR